MMMMSEEEKLEEFLLRNAMRGKWPEVVRMYSRDYRAHRVIITKAKETALHLAALHNQEEIVEELIRHICHFNTENVLKLENERKNTPLHFAASLGSVRMCEAIASVDSSLVDIRNDDGETPLFRAALHGHKNAFLYLHSLCTSYPNGISTNLRRKGGDSVLHSTIRNEYFDLAFQIINLNPETAHWVNEGGFTPLHLLARKPTAFRSSCCPIELWKKVIYYLSNSKKVFDGKKNPRAEAAADLEVGEVGESLEFDSLERNDLKNEIFPENYETCINFFKVVSMAILTLGFGSVEIRKIREKKEKHMWAVLVMNKLLEVAKDYKYGDDGSSSIVTKLKSEDTNETWPYGFDKMKISLKNVEGDDGSSSIATKSKSEDTNETSPCGCHKMKTSLKNVEGDQTRQSQHEGDDYEDEKNKLKETALLIAAKNGVVEMVDQILQQFPEAIHDVNSDYKNVVHLAVENRQPDVYTLLLSKKLHNESVFEDVDNEGNSALHLAANLRDQKQWDSPVPVLQMHWELQWKKYVKSTMPLHSSAHYNNLKKTPKMIFQKTHKELAKSCSEWLKNTSESSSLVATLVATVAFATSATIPGSHLQDKGIPVHLDQPAFMVFSISSFLALFLSVISVFMFLSILTSTKFQYRDFKWRLPLKLLIGFYSLFLSIVAMLVSYCAGHFFLLNPHLQNVALEVYTFVSVLAVLIFGFMAFPLYYDILQIIIKKVPHRSFNVIITD